MKKNLKILGICFRISISTATAYRANFIISSVITLLSNILFPLVTMLIYSSGGSFPEWNYWEVLLIQSIFTLSTGFSGIFSDGILWQTLYHVKEGNLEIVLIKPVDTLFYLMASTVSVDGFSLILGGGVMMGIALSNIGGITLLMVLQFFVLFIAGVLVMTGISLMMASTSFKWVANSRIPEIFDSIKNFGKYPLGIFPKAIQGFTSFIMPVSMIAYFPATALLGRESDIKYLMIIPCLLFFILGVFIYKKLIKLYESAGG